MVEHNWNCKIGKVTPRHNLVVLDNPLDAWSKEAVEIAANTMFEEQKEDTRVDAVVVYMHFSDGTALSHLNRHESCKLPCELLGEFIKQRVSNMKQRSDAREIVHEVLEDY